MDIQLVHCWWKPVTYLSFGVPTAADEVLDTKQKEMAIAMMIFEKSSNEEFCKPCSNNNHRGPGTECIVPDSSDYRKPSEGSCANCYGRMAAQKCSLRKGTYRYLATKLERGEANENLDSLGRSRRRKGEEAKKGRTLNGS